MQSRPESIQTSTLLLAKGQSHFEQLPRGTVIRVATGSVALVQRTALDHCMLAQQTTMPRGAVHCVEVPTWVEIVAQADADVVVMVPRAVSLGRALRSWLGPVCGRVRWKQKRALNTQFGLYLTIPWKY